MTEAERLKVQEEIKEAVQRMSLFSAQLYYHLTKEMVEDYGLDAAKETIKKAIRGFGLERGANIRENCFKSGVEPTIDNLHDHYDMPIEEGWSPHSHHTEGVKIEKEKDVVSEGCTESCIFADYWISKNWSEVGYLYCAVDNAIREAYNPNILYEPEKNILLGDDSCTATSSYKK